MNESSLLEQVLQLPLRERGAIAAIVLDSLEDDDEVCSQEELDNAWEAELNERLEAYRAGRGEEHSAGGGSSSPLGADRCRSLSCMISRGTNLTTRGAITSSMRVRSFWTGSSKRSRSHRMRSNCGQGAWLPTCSERDFLASSDSPTSSCSKRSTRTSCWSSPSLI